MDLPGTLQRRVADRISHRAGPVELDTLPAADDHPPEEIRVIRCLRCDAILWTSGPGLNPSAAPGLGSRVKLDRRCPGLIE